MKLDSPAAADLARKNKKVLGEVLYHLTLAMHGVRISQDHDIDMASLEDLSAAAREAFFLHQQAIQGFENDD